MLSINEICDKIGEMLSGLREPLKLISPIVLATCAGQRAGLSAMEIASNIIRRQGEAGAPYGPAADGTSNIAEAMERIRIEEIIKGIHTAGLIQTAIPVGGIQFVGYGANAGGPVVIRGFNVNVPETLGIMH